MHMRLLLLLGSLCLAGCYSDPYEAIRDRNKANLVQIALGNTKAQVLAACGTPDKNEQFNKGGVNFDVIFYYTDYIAYNAGKTWETGHTPVLLKDGKVIGIGWRAMRVNGIESSDISIETRSR